MKNFFLLLLLFPTIIYGIDFYQITDIHLQLQYTPKTYIFDRCGATHDDEGPDVPIPPKNIANIFLTPEYGSNYCDTSPIVLKSGLKYISSQKTEPSFLILTGDNIVSDASGTTYVNQTMIYDATQAITDWVQEYLPNTKAFPCLGNHDLMIIGHCSSFPPGPNKIYDQFAAIYEPFLDKQAIYTFLEMGGYYTMEIETGLRIIALNTMTFGSVRLENNGHTVWEQFDWLESVLKNATTDNEKVIIIAHYPPSYGSWWDNQYRQRYIDLCTTYSTIIISQFFGHTHSDELRLIGNTVGYITSSMTPYGSTTRNPSFRKMILDDKTYDMKDVEVYHLNLELANAGKPSWELLYSMRDVYNLKDLTYNTISAMIDAMDPVLHFGNSILYMYNYIFHGAISSVAGGTWYHTFSTNEKVCQIRNIMDDDYKKCMDHPG